MFQWKLNRFHYETQMKQRNEILDKMTQCFTNEKNTNIKLIKQNEDIKAVNKILEEENLKLKDTCKENSENIKILNEKIKLLEEGNSSTENKGSVPSEDLNGQIKEEPIEIDD